MTAEGFLYRVDMRLRPWGQVGALVIVGGRVLRPTCSGTRACGKNRRCSRRGRSPAMRRWARPLRRRSTVSVARSIAGARCATDVFAMKQRTEDHLRQQGREWGEVKLGQGSIRDVEFVVQYLQLAHGAEQPGIRSRTRWRRCTGWWPRAT